MGGGNSDLYLDLIVNYLKTNVYINDRTKKSAKNTFIFGSSLGGLVSLYAVLKYLKTFGNAGIFSLSFWYSEKMYEMLEKAPKSQAEIYMMCSYNEDAEILPDLKKMYRLLDKSRCYCLLLSKKKIAKGGKHNEKLWRDIFAETIRWLF